ncbi:hypothetical protein ABPG74_003318 [Tetrahymena malaccensis]
MSIQDNIDLANNFQEEDSHSGQNRESINNHNDDCDNQTKLKQSIKQGKKSKDAQVSFQSNTKTEDESEQSQTLSEDKRRVIIKRKRKAQNSNSELNDSLQKSNGVVRFKDSSDEIIEDRDKKRKGDDNFKDQSDNQDYDDDDNEDDENENYIVEKIIKKRIENRKCEYFVKWQGYSSKKNTWEPLSNLENVKDMIYQYEYDLPQTGKQPKVSKKILQKQFSKFLQQNNYSSFLIKISLDHTKIERIFGHDRIGKKSQYLVSYTDIPKPLWVLKNDLPISYKRQYESKLQANDPVCIIQQIKQASKDQESQQKRGRKSSQQSSEIENLFSKKVNNQLFSSMDEDDDEMNHQIGEDNQEPSQKQKGEKKRKLVKKTIISDVESNSVPQQLVSKQKKLGRPKKKFAQDSQNSSIVNNSQIEEDSTLSNKPRKKVKTSQEKLSSTSKNQQDNSSAIQNNLDKLSENSTNLSQSASQFNSKNDQQFLVKRESNQDPPDNTQIQQHKAITENYPKEGSFEAKDKVQRVIIRSSEKELEAMIFEVFWKPRPDGQQPRSKLVRYEELKKNSPESLIYWLEVMVKNSVKELESDDVIIKELREKVQQLELQIQNITVPTRQNLQSHHGILPFLGPIPQNIQFQHQQLQDLPINFQNNQNELLKAKFNNQNQAQQLLQNKNR